MMQPNATELTAQQERALAMLAAGERVVSVSRALKVDRGTIWRWTKLHAFRVRLEELQAVAWRDATDAMRHNVTLAADVLGRILKDKRSPARDRISAAKVVLGSVASGLTEKLAGSTAVPQPSDWREIMLTAARRAGEFAPSGPTFLFARTPGAAWAESGLERAFPGSFARLRALADQPERLAAECDALLSDFQDVLDGLALRR